MPCPVWLRWMVELDNPFTKTNRAGFIVQSLSLEPGMVVLDAGCGPGRVTVPLAQGVGPSGRVVALDIQAGMLARARVKAEAAGLANVEFVEGGLGEAQPGDAPPTNDDLPHSTTLPASSFDRAVLVTVLGEVPDREAALADLYRALKPGGVLAVVEVIFDPHFQTRGKVSSLAMPVGFREQAFFGHRLAYVLHLAKPR